MPDVPPTPPPEIPPLRPAPDDPPQPDPAPPPYRQPPARVTGGTGEAGWPGDLAARLMDRRIVVLSGCLDDAAASEAAARLMLLDATGDEPVVLHLACPDGDLHAAAALVDTIDLLGVPTHAHARGAVGGAAVWPLLAGRHRVAMPHARFGLREPAAHVAGPSTQLARMADALESLTDMFRRRIADVTGRPLGDVAADVRRGLAMDAREARDYGLVHEIAATT